MRFYVLLAACAVLVSATTVTAMQPGRSYTMKDIQKRGQRVKDNERAKVKPANSTFAEPTILEGNDVFSGPQ
ncbi:hypothetical protein Poli38472_012688 [Pythium oligandrum]|uniref:Uncharacterized protein n=1 Tax=Pythium oligandrum TaxID=41045 RepID=A0A8K1CG22_PYTOL|nr:hypothetical protein Poli38472_012688 [Pythium oligandrum]|eukprot:TMW61497.1 hypothetical protein Poli38472_012688 [Pythium oligandrum]